MNLTAILKNSGTITQQDIDNVQINLKLISELICQYYNLQEFQIFSKSRIRDLVIPRQMFHYLARKYTNETLNNIATYSPFRYFTHANVLYSKKTIDNLSSYSNVVMQDVKYFETLLNINQ